MFRSKRPSNGDEPYFKRNNPLNNDFFYIESERLVETLYNPDQAWNLYHILFVDRKCSSSELLQRIWVKNTIESYASFQLNVDKRQCIIQTKLPKETIIEALHEAMVKHQLIPTFFYECTDEDTSAQPMLV